LIFFSVPVSSAAKTGVLIRAAAIAAPKIWGTMRINTSSTFVFFMKPVKRLSYTANARDGS
jgi:hypothetical protein